MISAGQLDERGVVGYIAGQLLNGLVHLVEQGPLSIIADQALGPEKRGDASPRVTGSTLCRLVDG